MPWKLSFAMLLLVGAVIPGSTQATEWTELNDAGPVLDNAQEPIGSGALTAIHGEISATSTDVPINDLSSFGDSVADVDLYEIFISDPGAFSARTLNGDSENPEVEFDASLRLFDANGFGVYSNDDGVFDDGNSFLPAGSGLGPMEQGTYFLAIHDDDVTALSALNENGLIFPESLFPFTAVFGPSGPGGASPLIDWFPFSPINASRNYTILLTGVTLPEPGALTQALSALVALVALSSARRRSARDREVRLNRFRRHTRSRNGPAGAGLPSGHKNESV